MQRGAQELIATAIVRNTGSCAVRLRRITATRPRSSSTKPVGSGTADAAAKIAEAAGSAAVGTIKTAGADMIGGCCGTNPDFIKELAKAVC